MDEITDKFSTFVNPQVPIPFEIEQLTSINDNMVHRMRRPSTEVLPEFLAFCEGAVMVAHNASFRYELYQARMRARHGTAI